MLITSSCFTEPHDRLHLSYRCLCTPQTGRHRFADVVLGEVRHDVATSASSEMLTCGWLYSSWLEVESGYGHRSELRVCTAQPADLRGLFHFRVARYAAGCRCGLINVVFTRRNSSVAVAPRISFARGCPEYLAVQQRYGQHPDAEPRLRHAKLVYTVTQDINVLLHAYSRASLRRASLITARSWLRPGC